MGTALGQGVVLLATPYLARHYSQETFGALAVLMTITNISTAAACLRYDMAMPACEEAEVRGLFLVTLVSAFGTAALAFAATELAMQLGFMHGHLEGRGWPPLVGACVLLVGLFQATNGYYLRRGSYRLLSVTRFSQGGLFAALAIVPGIGLLWSQALSFAGGLLGCVGILGTHGAASNDVLPAAKRNRGFPLLSLPGALLDSCGYSVCIWVIASEYGAKAAGNYSQIQRIIGAPLMLLSMSIGQILLRQTAELAGDRQGLVRFLLRVLGALSVLALAALLALWWLGEPLFRVALGRGWLVDRSFLEPIALGVFVRACISPLSSVLITLRKFRRAFFWQLSYFCSASLVLPLLAHHLVITEYVIAYAAHEVVFYTFYLILIVTAIKTGGRSA